MPASAPKITSPPAAHRTERLADVLELPRGERADAKLVTLALDGQSWAHEAIYRRYVQRIGRVARSLLRDDSEVDDVVQETFLIAFETLARLGDPSALRSWLTGIAVHRVHRRFRWSRWTRLWTSAELAASLETQLSAEAGPDQRAELARIDRVLQKLPVTLRLPWVLRHVLGDSLDDIAGACGCSLATVKRRIGEAERHVDAHVAGTGAR